MAATGGAGFAAGGVSATGGLGSSGGIPATARASWEVSASCEAACAWLSPTQYSRQLCLLVLP